MDIKPLIGVSYELIFQIFNTIIVLGIFVFIVYLIFNFSSKLINKNKYENKINNLENKLDNK